MHLPTLLALLPVTLALSASAPLQLLSPNTPGKCLDGTPSGFYFLPQSQTKWTLTLFGGGECSDAPSCTSKVTTNLGSSKYFSKTMGFDGAHYADPNPSSNPGFADWSHVQIPYCSQDLHMGTRTNVSGETFGLYFSGHLIFEEILNALEASTPSLKDATDILLTGDSAGGIGSWPHLDWLAARYPNARVVGAPVAGFYFYSYPYLGPNHTHSILAPFDAPGIQALHDLYQPFLDTQCSEFYASQGLSPAPCMLSNYSLPFVTTPVFVTEAQTDSVQLADHDDVPTQYVELPEEQAYLAEWKANMSVALAKVLSPASPKLGGFNPACFIHTSFSPTAPLINGLSFLQAAALWHAQGGAPSAYKLADNCGLMCNPTCPPS